MTVDRVRKILEWGVLLPLAVFFAVCTISLSLSGCVGCQDDYSEGERTGMVVKVSKKGLFINSWESTMHVGSSPQAATAANAWHFSTRDPIVVRQLQHAERTGEVVRIRYKRWWKKPFWIESHYVAQMVYSAGGDVPYSSE